MIIMILAYTQVSGNKTFIDSHYDMLHKWTLYLGNNSLVPNNQYAMVSLQFCIIKTLKLIIQPQTLGGFCSTGEFVFEQRDKSGAQRHHWNCCDVEDSSFSW